MKKQELQFILDFIEGNQETKIDSIDLMIAIKQNKDNIFNIEEFVKEHERSDFKGIITATLITAVILDDGYFYEIDNQDIEITQNITGFYEFIEIKDCNESGYISKECSQLIELNEYIKKVNIEVYDKAENTGYTKDEINELNYEYI